MSATTTSIILEIDKKKEKSFLEMLKLFDFVQVVLKQDVRHGFPQNAPQNVPLTEEEVVAEVMAHRYGEKK